MAWVRWATAREGLTGEAIAATLDAVFDAMARSPRSTVTRPRSAWSSRWWPAAARRRPGGAAAPGLRVPGAGRHSGTDLGSLDPADPRTGGAAGRRPRDPGRRRRGRHIERHLALADRLWRGDPPELWEAAQRLLDLGEDRHAVLHALMAVLDHTSGDEAALIAVLRELEADGR